MLCAGGFSGLSFAQIPENPDKNQSSGTENSLSAEKTKEQFSLGGDKVKTDRNTRTITFIGNAKFIRDEMSTFCDTLVIYWNQAQEVEKAVAIGNVRLVTEDITETGEQGTFYNEDQKVELEGKAKAWQGNNTITAHRLIAFLDKKIVEGYSDPASERVVMTVYSQQDILTSEKNSDRSNNTIDQEVSPIVIESDILKYNDSDQKAIFTGNVVATKDISTISADEMIVYLTRTKEAEENDIERIEVSGNVRVVQENITITGQKGVYLNKEQQAVIEGTAEKRAQAEDKIQNNLLKADTIRMLLATNDIEAEGNVSVQMLLGSNEKK